MVPGAHPFAELEAALLRSTIDAPNSLDTQLADPTLGLLRAALRLLPDDTTRLVLLIDQFEELFTLVDDEAERRRFLANLVAAVDDPQGRVLVVLTLRADSYHRPLAYGEFAARLGPGVINVLPLTTDELEEAAQEPAARRGVTFEPALLAELLTDVIGEPGALPMFQYALTELFDRRDRRPAHARRLPLDGRRARRAHPAGRRPVPPPDARRAGGGPPAVPAPGDDHRAGAVGPATGAGVGDRGDRRRRGDDGIGDRPVRPAPLPRLRPRPRNGRTDGRGRPRGAAVGVGPPPRVDRGGSRRHQPASGTRDRARRVEPVRARQRLPAHRQPARRVRALARRDDDAPDHRRAGVPRRLARPARRRGRGRSGPRSLARRGLARRARRRWWALVAVVVGLAVAGRGGVRVRSVRAADRGHGQADRWRRHHRRACWSTGSSGRRGTSTSSRSRSTGRSADIDDELASLADSGTDLVVFTDFLFAESWPTAADKYPDTTWAFVDIPVPGTPAFTFAEHEGAYLAGAAAALTSETGTIGYVGGFQFEHHRALPSRVRSRCPGRGPGDRDHRHLHVVGRLRLHARRPRARGRDRDVPSKAPTSCSTPPVPPAPASSPPPGTVREPRPPSVGDRRRLRPVPRRPAHRNDHTSSPRRSSASTSRCTS